MYDYALGGSHNFARAWRGRSSELEELQRLIRRVLQFRAAQTVHAHHDPQQITCPTGVVHASDLVLTGEVT